MADRNSCLPAALSYATELKWAVIPVHWPEQRNDGRVCCSCGKAAGEAEGECSSAGKHPLTPHGFKDASKDPAVIKAWWNRWPHANVGIATGAISGLWVLDIDPKNEGDETLHDLELKFGRLPFVTTAITGSRGAHYFFEIPSDCSIVSRVNVLPGIDVRGDGGFVVAAPSLHKCGRTYDWDLDRRPEAVRPGPAPRWLLDVVLGRIQTKGSQALKSVNSPDRAANVPQGDSTSTSAHTPSPSSSQDSRVDALVAALTPYWPPTPKNRHDLALAFGGWSVKNGIPFAAVEQVLKVVCASRRDGDVKDRVEAARASFQKHNEGKVVAGASRLPQEMLQALKSAWLDERRKDGDGLSDAGASAPDEPALPEEKFQQFPVGVLPEPLRQFVGQAALAIGCCFSYVALPLLAAIAAAIGNTRRIRLKNSWTEPAVIWGVTVGESGTLKTPPFDAALHALRRRQDLEFLKFKERQQQHEDEKAQYEADIRAWRAKKPPRGEPPKKPEKPSPPRIIVSDPTVEALAVILQYAPRGVLLARDELAGWIGSFDQYKSKSKGSDAPHYLEMFRAGSVTVDRKGDPSTIHVPYAAVSVCGTIQPAVLARVLGTEHFEDGFAARLLITMPTAKRKEWTENDISQVAQDAISRLFDKLFALDFALSADGLSEPFIVKMSEEAKVQFVTFYNEHAGELADLQGDEAALWSKLEGYVPRFALTFFLVRQAWGDAKGDDVEAQDVKSAIILARWFGREAKRVYGILKESGKERESRRLIELIERRGGRITANDLRRFDRRYRKGGATDALNTLVVAKQGRWVTKEGELGRPCDIFELGAVYESTKPPSVLSAASPRENAPSDADSEIRRFVDTPKCEGKVETVSPSPKESPQLSNDGGDLSTRATPGDAAPPASGDSDREEGEI